MKCKSFLSAKVPILSWQFIASATLLVCWQATAANVTWDITPGAVGAGDSAITGGVGTWDTTLGNWTTDGGANNIAWNNLANDTAIFSGSPGGNVTLTGNVSAGGLTFNVAQQLVGSPFILTLAGATPTVNVATSLTETILPPIAGIAGLTKTGEGILNLQSGVANSFTGGIFVNGGQVNANGATITSNVIDPTNALTLNSGGFALLVGAGVAGSQTLAGTTLAAGVNAIRINGNGAGTDTLALGAITRASGATLTVSVGYNTTPGTLRQIQSSSWALGTIVDSGVAYATFVQNTSSATAPTTGDDWASYSGALTGKANYTFSDATTLVGDADITTMVDTTLAADASISSLHNNLDEARTININGNILTTGGILIGSNVKGNTTTITGGTLRSAATVSGKDLVLIANNPGATSIASVIANAAAGATGLTKSGTGSILLSGTNSYTGPTIINGGSLSSAKAASLSTTPSVLINGGGALTVSYGGLSSYTNSEITTLLAKTIFANSTSSFGFDTTDAIGGTANYAGGYSGATGLAKSGAGSLVLTGANTHTGITSVFGGTLQIQHAGALGGTTLGTTISNGAAIALTGGITITGEALSLTGIGVSAGGALRNISGGNSWTGTITPVGIAQVTADAGTLTLGAVASTGGILSLTGNGVITVGGIVSGTTAVTVEDLLGNGTTSGTMILNGLNTHTGDTTVASGVLTLSGARTVDSGSITVGNTSGKTAALNYSNGNFSTGIGDIQVGALPSDPTAVGIVNHTSGTLSTTPTTASNGRILLGGGGTGTYNLSNGTLNANGTGSNALILGTNSGGNATFNLSGTGSLVMGSPGGYLQIGRSNSTTSANSGTFTQTGGTANIANLSMGGGGLNNVGTIGVLNLSGGNFTVAGAFNVLSAGDSCTSTITIGGTADVTLPAFPTARGTGSNATLTLDGGTLRPAATSATYISNLTNAFIKAGGAKFDVATGNDIVIPQALLTDAVSTGGGLTKNGVGALVLSGACTYTGPTAVNAGIFGIYGAGSLAAGSTVTVGSAAILGGDGTIGGTLNSTGIIAPGPAAVGTLTTGPANLTGGTLAIEVSGATADKLFSTGALSLSGISLSVTELSAGTAFPYVIAQGTSRSGTFLSVPSGYSVSYNATQAILNVAAVGSYATWIDNYIAQLPNAADRLPGADPENDGLSNLTEYALGLNPTTSSVPVGTLSGGGKIITFTKGTDALANGDVRWIIQTSSSLNNDWIDRISQAPPGNTDPTISWDFGTMPGGPKVFARLKVIQNP